MHEKDIYKVCNNCNKIAYLFRKAIFVKNVCNKITDVCNKIAYLCNKLKNFVI